MSNVAAAAQARLGALRVVRVHLPSVDSTNKYATAHVRTFDPHVVTVVTADEQTAGRGRMGRVWKSGADDVKATFAFALPAHAVATAYQLSPLVAVVATRVLRRQGVDVGIKWPNDLMIAGSRKFAGILCELEHVLGEGPADPPRYWAALGIGINVNSAKEALEEAVGPRPVWPLTTLRSETGRTYDVTALADELVAEFAESLPRFLADGFAPFQADYESRNILLGKRIRFLEGTARVEGRVVSFGSDGMLYLQLPDSVQPRGFLSGEVSGIELAPGEFIEGCVE